MPPSSRTRMLERTVGRLPVVRRLPVFRLLALAEIALLARDHLQRLDPQERARLIALVRKGQGRTRGLTEAERDELAVLVAKVEPRALAGTAVGKLSPVPLPRRLTHGAGKR